MQIYRCEAENVRGRFNNKMRGELLDSSSKEAEPRD